jgi:BirA family biotin operon repressor/biotin-[acetyl-CoA-carboxylase] ligase
MPCNTKNSDYTKKEKGGLWNADLLAFEAVSSTNEWALNNITSLKHGDIICTTNQTAGRGRFNRAWIAPPNCNLSLSAIINHTHTTIPVTMLLPTTAITIRDALKEFKIDAALKWPNDVMVSGKKIAGILAEIAPENNFLVIGIGLNININIADLSKMDFPQPPTSMMAEKNIMFNIDTVRTTILQTLKKTIDTLYKTGIPYIAQRWQENDYLQDKTISIKNEKEIITGRYNGMKNNGQLEIIDQNGTSHSFWSGDITLRSNN